MSMKIVIVLDEKGASIGLQKPDCDPILSRVEGDLPVALKSIPKLVKDAESAWEAKPHYDKCETDLKPPGPPTPPVRTAQKASQPRTEQPSLL